MQFEDVSFFIKASDEDKLLLFQHGEIKRIGLPNIGMLDAGMWINNNIDPAHKSYVSKLAQHFGKLVRQIL